MHSALNLSYPNAGCSSDIHDRRRALMRMVGLSGLSWISPLATCLARQSEQSKESAKSLILLWLEGGPSQLETFDPKPGTKMAAGSTARTTRADRILLGDGLEQLADQMDAVSLLRTLTLEEGDHERAQYNVKAGYRPDPTLVHPAIGAVICHQFQAADSTLVDIPRHVSILTGRSAGRGGYLGDAYDAFKIGDPVRPLPDMLSGVNDRRQESRLNDLRQINQYFSNGRTRSNGGASVLGQDSLNAAIKMMTSAQLDAFDVSSVPISDRLKYGDTEFGRGCLTALRLIQAGVRCVEVTLSGWDTHIDNHQLQGQQIKILDPAFAALIADLRQQDLLDSTIVLCGGEFGRTPRINALGGRDHWPHGFSVAIAGGGIPGGRAIGETCAELPPDSLAALTALKDPHPIQDLHATIFRLLGIDHQHELITPVGRPLKISQGNPIQQLMG